MRLGVGLGLGVGGRVGTSGPVVLRYVPGDDPPHIYYYGRASAARYVDVNGVVQLAVANMQRDAHYLGGERTWLIESERTNLLTADAIGTGAWVLTAATAAAASGIAPDGTNSATKLVATASGNNRGVYQPIDTAAAQYAASVFAKPSGKRWLATTGFDGSNAVQGSFVDALNAVAGQVRAGYAVGAQARADGWTRSVVTGPAAAGTSYFMFDPTDADATGYFTVNGGDGLLLWFPQVEAGAYPTSPTVGTRAADILTFDAFAFPTTCYARWRDINTAAVQEAVFETVANTRITMPADRAYTLIKIARGSFTLAEMQAL